MVTEEETVVTAIKTRYLLSALVRQSSNLKELEQAIGEHGGEIIKSEDLGERKLAFQINKQAQLNLVSVFFMMAPSEAFKLESSLQQSNHQERFLLTKWNADPEAPSRRNRERVKEGESA